MRENQKQQTSPVSVLVLNIGIKQGQPATQPHLHAYSESWLWIAAMEPMADVMMRREKGWGVLPCTLGPCVNAVVECTLDSMLTIIHTIIILSHYHTIGNDRHSCRSLIH